MGVLTVHLALTLTGHCTPEPEPWPSANFLLAKAGNHACGDYIVIRKRVCIHPRCILGNVTYASDVAINHCVAINSHYCIPEVAASDYNIAWALKQIVTHDGFFVYVNE